MGYNDFHKGFVNQNQIQKPNIVMKKKFGVRSIDDIIESRYEKRENSLPVQPKIQEKTSTDYQQNMRGQRNIRNLDK